MWVPVDVEVKFADGSSTVERWDDPADAHWKRFVFDRSSRVVEVQIDPMRKVLLSDAVLDDHLRLIPDERASARAAARIGFWTHTTMQVTGL